MYAPMYVKISSKKKKRIALKRTQQPSSYLFNFSYKSKTVVLHHSHITAVFVNTAFSDEDKINAHIKLHITGMLTSCDKRLISN